MDLNQGTDIEREDLPQSVRNEIDERANCDDVNARLLVSFDGTVYKVISFGTQDWGNPNTYALGVFDQGGKLVGRCMAEFGEQCELKPED